MALRYKVAIFALLCMMVWTPTISQEQGKCTSAGDIVFVLDSSGSIRDQNPSDGSYDNWDLILSFVVRVVENLDVGENAARVGLVVYSNMAANQFFLNEYFDKNELIAQVRATPYIGGNTNTSGGLRLMTHQQFTLARGDRPNVNNFGVVITDGESNEDVERVIPDAREAERQGIKVFAIGITNAVNTQELASISSTPHRQNENWWSNPEFTTLTRIISDVSQAICANPIPVTTGITQTTENTVTPIPCNENPTITILVWTVLGTTCVCVVLGLFICLCICLCMKRRHKSSNASSAGNDGMHMNLNQTVISPVGGQQANGEDNQSYEPLPGNYPAHSYDQLRVTS